jgi:hypothetical protein
MVDRLTAHVPARNAPQFRMYQRHYDGERLVVSLAPGPQQLSDRRR